MNRQRQIFFPALHSANFAPQVRSDFAPGLETALFGLRAPGRSEIRRFWHWLGSVSKVAESIQRNAPKRNKRFFSGYFANLAAGRDEAGLREMPRKRCAAAPGPQKGSRKPRRRREK